MSKSYISITIKGNQGSGKSRIHQIIQEALAKEGYSIRKMHPIPTLGIEDATMVYSEETDISLYTLQREVTNG